MLPKKVKLKNGNITTIRYLCKEDLEDIWEIFNQVVAEMKFIPVINPVISKYEKENWYFHQNEEKNVIIVSEIDKKIVGHCMIEHIGWDAAVHVGELGIIISPSYRNIGIGKIIIQEALKAAQEKLFEKICLSCFHTNIHALNLYKSVGFRKVGYREQQFKLNGTYYDEILMELKLKDIKYRE